MLRESLEAKLKAIQELKAERYIGTQQAWNYLKSFEKLKDSPKSKKELYKKEAFYEFVSLSSRIEKIIKDQVDHRLERRREVITDFIILHDFKSYEEIVIFLIILDQNQD